MPRSTHIMTDGSRVVVEPDGRIVITPAFPAEIVRRSPRELLLRRIPGSGSVTSSGTGTRGGPSR
jgi:hypothetical protein